MVVLCLLTHLVLTTLPPLLLPIHCLFILIFRRWLGPIGTFYASLWAFCFLNVLLLYTLTLQLTISKYFFFDFGAWFSCLNLIDSHLAFCNDFLASCTALLVAFLTPIALYFGVEYMFREAFANRLLYLLNLFAASVILLFYAYDFFLILLFWECVGLFSLLLVNFYSTRIYTLKAALKTFVFSRISDMFLFGAFILSVNVFHSCDLSLIFIQAPFLSLHYIFFGSIGLHFLTILAFLIAAGAVIKCAQFGFHVWLPDAMEAPTPASALIHSSTLVVAGVFLIIRFSLIFEFSYYVNLGLALLGSTTLAFSAVAATFQQDIKKLVAYSTISQIGYLVCGCGFGCYDETLVYLIIHAINKAFLFVLVGYVVHLYSGNTDLRFMGASHIFSFDIAVILLILAANLSGLPYLAGFAGKEFLVTQFALSSPENLYIRFCWQVAFVFTPIYMFALIFGVVYGPMRSRKNIWQSLFLISRQVKLIGSVTDDSNRKISAFFNNSWIASSVSSFFYLFLIFLVTALGEEILLIFLNFSSSLSVSSTSSWLTNSSHFFTGLKASTLSYLNFLFASILVSFYAAYRYLISWNNSLTRGVFLGSVPVSNIFLIIIFSVVIDFSFAGVCLVLGMIAVIQLVLRVFIA